MGRNTSKHIPKSINERRYYHDFIKNQDYVPTVDDSLNFEETTNNDKEFKVEENKRRRPKPIKEQLIDHFTERWITYVIGVLTFVFSYLMFNAKVDIARIFVKTENIEKNVDKVSSDIKELNNKTDQKIDALKEKSNEQDMKIKENEIKLEYLKRK